MFLAIISALPKILSLVSLIMQMVRDGEQRGIGRAEAINEALTNAHRDIAYASAAEDEARASHAKTDDDAAFDQEFKRNDP